MDSIPVLELTRDGKRPHRQSVDNMLDESEQLAAIGYPEAAIKQVRTAFELTLRAKACIENCWPHRQGRRAGGNATLEDLAFLLQINGRIDQVQKRHLSRYIQTMHAVSHGEGVFEEFVPQFILVTRRLRLSLLEPSTRPSLLVLRD